MTAVMQVALRVAAALEHCGVAYVIGGSLASSLNGEPRSTLDVDIVAALTQAAVACLEGQLGQDFYLDSDDLCRALGSGSSSNLIHHATGVKVDLFPAHSPLQQQHLCRRQSVRVDENPERQLFFYTAEDILLQKLLWYRQGGETAGQQWRDVLGLLRAGAASLDWAYLEPQAKLAAVADLLARARQALS